VLVYNGTTGTWDDLMSQGDLTSTTFTTKEYTLAPDHVAGNGYVRARFIGRNESDDSVNSNLNVEYFRIKSAGGYFGVKGEAAGDNFGFSVSNASDINEDGSYDDIIVGAPGYSNNKGRAYIFNGGDPMDSTADVTLTGENNGDEFGYSVSAAGDLDGDGDPDVIVGAPYFTNGSKTECGAFYVFCGGSDIDATEEYKNEGEYAYDHFGWSVSLAGDMNNDNINDVIIGAPHYDTQASETPPSVSDAGKVYIMCIPEFDFIALPLMIITVLILYLNKHNRNHSNSNQKPRRRKRKKQLL
jgi:hypothetical protein